jgi:hypothetical protein
MNSSMDSNIGNMGNMGNMESTPAPAPSLVTGGIFMFLSLMLCVTYLITAIVQEEISNGIKITTLVCWLIFGTFFSYILYTSNNVTMNAGISFFVILVSCILTFRQVNVIKTCIV